MAQDRIRHRQLSFYVVGCEQRVHAALGPGFPEGVYHRALCVELAEGKIPFESEKTVEVFYRKTRCGEFRCDLVVSGSIVLELKALESLNDQHVAQVLSYLKATGLELAIVLNFGAESLQTKRVVL